MQQRLKMFDIFSYLLQRFDETILRARTFKNKLPLPIQALLVSVCLILLIFPDVIFMRASISMTGFFIGQEIGRKVVCLYPEPPNRAFYHAFNDAGGGMFQSEPMQLFMAYCMRHHESPYWNPYSGCGQLGPETLVDLKFSFFTILFSLLGGSQIAYHVITLVLLGTAIFFLFFTLNLYFELTFLASICACIVYLLNGYMVANLGSNTAQVYFYFPSLLFALCAFAHKPSTWRFLALVLANIIVLSTTFLPTCFLMLVGTYLIAAGYLISLCGKKKQLSSHYAWRIFFLQGLAAMLAFGTLGFLFFPIVESFKVIDLVSHYSARLFYPANFTSLLSFFSAKHFWDAYPSAIPPILYSGLPNNPNFRITNNMFHFGIIPSVLAVSALAFARSWRTPIVVTLVTLLTISLGRIFGICVLSDLISVIPGLRNVGEQYWFQVPAIAFPLITAFGLDAIRQSTKYSWLLPLSVYILLCTALAYVYTNYGIREPKAYILSSVFFIVAMNPISAFLVYLVRKFQFTKSAVFCLLILIATFIELTHNAIHYRYVRTDFFKRPSPIIGFLKKHIGWYRIATIGSGILPAEYGSAFQIQQIESLNMGWLPSYNKFFENNFLKDQTMRWTIFPTMFCFRDEPSSNVNIPMFDALSVKHILISSSWSNYRSYLEKHGYRPVATSVRWLVYENPHVFPRIFAVPTVLRGDPGVYDVTSLRKAAYTMDIKLLDSAKYHGLVSSILKQPEQVFDDNAVCLSTYHHDYLSATAKLKQPALVVLMDNWHPNWKATVDGKDTYIGLVNGSFRGLIVPAGIHKITMRYMPSTLPLAMLVSGTCIMFLGSILLFRKRIDTWCQA